MYEPLLRAYKASFTLIAASILLFSAAAPVLEAQGIPDNLKPSLDLRLQRYVNAQKEGRWEEVGELLGRYRMGGARIAYTAQHKQCLLAQMRSAPLVLFNRGEETFSTEILSLPPSRRWWYLDGQGTVQTEAGNKSGKVGVVAYRDAGQWYFTPFSYDREWERKVLTEKDLAADYSAELELEPSGDSPIELVDLSVRMDPNFRSLRVVEFRVRNKTGKAISGYGMHLASVDNRGQVLSGGAHPIAAGETSEPKKLSYSAYLYFCEPRVKHRLGIDEVSFVDGSEWKSPSHNKYWNPSAAGKQSAKKK